MTRTIMAIQGLGVLVCALASGICNASSWAPINPDELKMTSEPKAPGASAIILELQVDNNDREDKITIYQRIKVLTEEGRKYGDIEIPYNTAAWGAYQGYGSVRDIAARVIHPDGRINEFNGEVYDKLVVKTRDVKYKAKTFSLPDVSVGSIIELHFVAKYHGADEEISGTRWVLSEKLFTKHARYTFIPGGNWQLRWSWPNGLPPGTTVPIEKNGKVFLETHDVPAYVEEDYMPPVLESLYRVDFFDNFLRIQEKSNPQKFWKEADNIWYRFEEQFMDYSGTMERAVSRIVQPGDSPEQKLRKLYAHVQQLRNLTYEKKRSRKVNVRNWKTFVAWLMSKNMDMAMRLHLCIFMLPWHVLPGFRRTLPTYRAGMCIFLIPMC